MEVGDVEAIGKHCKTCGQLDFLPFQCIQCGGIFCGDHRSLDSHACPKAPKHNRTAAATPAKPSIYSYERQCADPKCKTLIGSGVGMKPQSHCDTCNRTYCYPHRMPEDHNCANLTPIGARPQNALQIQRDRAGTALARLKAWADNKKEQDLRSKMKSTSLFSSKKTVAANAERDRLAALKKGAKGTASLAQEKRVYLFVEASADTTKAKHPSGTFFYDKTWNVGRVLDAAAKALQVENVNNRGGGEEEKLRVFHVEAGRLLRFQEKIGEACVTGNMIVLLRGVGDPDLIDLRD
ncbi:hypothetical protein EJ04DRAFT_517518 [Polyplosphaeria fusca]|uniref:AN1-type domain-containing protein n=1 Tax=Polyplosphaeria fusca TaxID=682080 RepID=A0A9P4QLN8_9PLEO|nr:hypothetical protein EJ04DRAFT_517518 [Polyplosphaeria fusca]